MKAPSIAKLISRTVLLAIFFECAGCGGAAKERAELERTLARSAVVFVCLHENDQYVVRKIFKAEKSWGSDIKIGDAIKNLPVRNDPLDVGVLVTRESYQWAVNGPLAQGAIPFDRKGRLFFGAMSLREVAGYYDQHAQQTQKP